MTSHNASGRLRVIVCGGRDYDDQAAIERELEFLTIEHPDEVLIIVHGDARGADRIAGHVARDLDLTVENYPADWRRHGKAAGAIRNQAMLDAGADLVVAFPGGRGTADMVRRAKDAGVKVIEVDDQTEAT